MTAFLLVASYAMLLRDAPASSSRINAAVRMQQATAPAVPVLEDAAVLLTGEGLSQTYDGKRYQFRDVGLTIARGSKVGLVGDNGCGKSTLLKVLAGAMRPAEGGRVVLKRNTRLVYVEQVSSYGLVGCGLGRPLHPQVCTIGACAHVCEEGGMGSRRP